MSTEVALSEYIDGNTETCDSLHQQDETNEMKPESTRTETQNDENTLNANEQGKNEIKPGSTQELPHNENPIEEDTKIQQEDESEKAEMYRSSMPSIAMNFLSKEDMNVEHDAKLLVTGYLRRFVLDLPEDVEYYCNKIVAYGSITKIMKHLQENVKKNHREEFKNVIRSLYYIYFDHTITGPFKPEDILILYVTSKIEEEIWIKRADGTHEWVDWVSIKLKATSTDQKEKENEENDEFRRKFPELHDYLMPKIKLDEFTRVEPPLDVPKEAAKKLSTGRRVIKWIGYILLAAATLIVGVHTLFIGICIFGCLIMFPEKILDSSVCDCIDEDNMVKWIFLTIILSSLGLIIVPFLIVYLVLLGEVDLDYWDDEIQSWMIGYIAWGICSFLLMLSIPLWVVLRDCVSEETIDGILDRFLAAEFWILGVSFGSISIKSLIGGSKSLSLMFVFIFPACAAVLPSFIIGFIANFALEEKFELQCNDDYGDSGSNLCYNDGSGCCEVISSHDISNTYTFVGGLASNILATWAVIRICGYLLVAASDEASVFAKRNK